MRKTTLFISIIAIVLAAVSLFGADLYLFAIKPADESADKKSRKKVIVVKPGQNIKKTAENLFQKGIIKSDKKFKLLARFKGADKKIKAGDYLLSTAMSPNEIIDKIIHGKSILHRITVPEGYNIQQIASLVQEAGLGKKEDYIKKATDPSFVSKMNIEADTFEGYLFPDTYYFSKGVTAKRIVQTMVKRFRSVYKPDWEKKAGELGFSTHQVVILASMIEKETGAAFERPLISSVFHNRLKKKMRLASDPTVIYGIKDYDGNITKKHLRTRTPYNTYRIKGLPQGPIANPGIKSLEAALFPDDTDYLYFVSKKDSTHKFSTNITAHNRAVRKYQLRR